MEKIHSIKPSISSRVYLVLLIGIIMFTSIPIDISYAANNLYAIQMGRFESLLNANKMYDKIKSVGATPVLIKDGAYIVYFGSFDTVDLANKKLNDAKKIEKGAYVVKLKDSQILLVNDFLKTKSSSYDVSIIDGVVIIDGDSETKDVKVSTESKVVTGSVETKVETPTIKQNTTSNVMVDLVQNKSATNNTSTSKFQAYNQLLNNNITLQGVYGQASSFFTVNNYWQLSETAYFDLFFQHSQAGGYYGSSITVILNGVPIDSFFIDKMDSTEHNVRIALPKKFIKEGFNEIKFRTYHRITDEKCEDDANPANWVTIFGKSFLHIEYKDDVKNADLSFYPFPYIKEYQDQPVNFNFLINDDKPSLDEVKAILTIASDAGKRVKFKNMHFKFTKLSEIKADENYIFVGTSVPDQLKKYTSKNSFSDSSKSYIAQYNIDQDSNILMLISEDVERLSQLAKGLANEVWKSQLESNYISFDQNDLVQVRAEPGNGIFSFADLGYSNVTLEGAKASSAQFFIDVPDNWIIDEGASLALKMRYSKVIDFSNSSVSVVINDIPIGSEVLDISGVDEDILTFKIPQELRESKSFAISVNVNLEGDFDCNDSSINKNFWSFISSESSIYLPHIEKKTYSLFDYPAPFVSDFSMENLNFVLDANYSVEDITLMSDVIAYLSHQISDVSDYNISINELDKESNNIIISNLDSEIIKKVNSNMNIPYDYDLNQYRSDESYRLIDPFNSSLGTIQLLEISNSPFMNLVVSYQGVNGSKVLSSFLTDLEFVNKLGGNSVFINQNGYYQVFNTNKELEKELISTSTLINNTEEVTVKRVSFENSRNFIIFLGFLMLALIIIIVVIWSKPRRKL